jgi:hypothetical protein
MRRAPLFTFGLPQRLARCAAVLAALGLCISAARANVSDYDAFARLPVQDGGRIMPLDTYARLRLLQFSGRSSFEGKPAIEWLAGSLFDPLRASTIRYPHQ